MPIFGIGAICTLDAHGSAESDQQGGSCFRSALARATFLRFTAVAAGVPSEKW